MLIAYIPELVSLSDRVSAWFRDFKGMRPRRKVRSHDPMIDGVPVYDLVDLLFRFDGLPVVESKQWFGISPKEIKKLGDNMERVGILGRGPNNSRVLVMRDQDLVCDMLRRSGGDSDSLRAALLQVSESEYVTSNSMKTACVA